MELGADLLPDEADANARVQVYRAFYGADICARGFVAMRLTRAEEIKEADESCTLQGSRCCSVRARGIKLRSGFSPTEAIST